MAVETLNDLCSDTVTLDYKTMRAVSSIAFGYALESVSERVSTLRQLNLDPLKRRLEAEWLSDDAYRLSIAANMLSTLENGANREQVNVVNK